MKSVYTGVEKVAEFENYDELRVGDNKPAFIYEGSELVYPNPIKDGLVLWYDFSGRTNTDGQRGIAEDLSGNGNHGTLQNFNYTSESGYDKNKILFDGVDDRIVESTPSLIPTYTFDATFTLNSYDADIGGIFENYSSGVGGACISSYGYANVDVLRLYYADGNKQQKSPAKRVPLNATINTVVVFNDSGLKWYINGELVREENHGYTPFSDKGYRLGNHLGFNHYNLDGGIFSAKAYNRPLTPSEIAHNYAIEKERFGIE